MKYHQQWWETYRGVVIEIREYPLCEERAWAFYLHLFIEQFPTDGEKLWIPPTVSEFGSTFYNFGQILDLSFHHGCSYYAKEVDPDQPFRRVTFGCDYHHYWDQGRSYGEQILLSDAKKCVDEIHELYPDFIERDTLWKNWREKNYPAKSTPSPAGEGK